jgi:hypothetical protein
LRVRGKRERKRERERERERERDREREGGGFTKILHGRREDPITIKGVYSRFFSSDSIQTD